MQKSISHVTSHGESIVIHLDPTGIRIESPDWSGFVMIDAYDPSRPPVVAEMGEYGELRHHFRMSSHIDLAGMYETVEVI